MINSGLSSPEQRFSAFVMRHINSIVGKENVIDGFYGPSPYKFRSCEPGDLYVQFDSTGVVNPMCGRRGDTSHGVALKKIKQKLTEYIEKNKRVIIRSYPEIRRDDGKYFTFIRLKADDGSRELFTGLEKERVMGKSKDCPAKEKKKPKKEKPKKLVVKLRGK